MLYILDIIIARYILGTTEGNTDDIQDGRKIDNQIHSTCVESKSTRRLSHKIKNTQNETLRIATRCH